MHNTNPINGNTDDGEGWCDLPVWNPGNTEDGDISLVGSCSWMTPPWCPGTDICILLEALTPPSPHPHPHPLLLFL
ncbi:unnamed protein product [Staurois parvus]|uniref:Uncharacterized protein n=1 Tax=Staurois parvus TaxID=386267 RepID=A0ABN9CFU9_9NEOB|nr:unnamed protein product [Staurois parvus]